MKKKLRRVGLVLLGLVLLGFAGVCLLTWSMAAEARVVPPVVALGQESGTTAGSANSLRVMTLNMAHSRNTSFNQVFLDEDEIYANLDAIAAVLLREGPAVVALQEADGASLWSGDFNHVAYLGRQSLYPWLVRGEHVRGFGLSYGTALLSKLPVSDPLAITFAPTPPTPAKGFVRFTVPWPGSDRSIDVASVHLDFLRASVRAEQIACMVQELKNSPNPLVVMGDFNCQWTDREESLRTLARELDLRPCEPEDRNRVTFPVLKKRLDWILISPELDFAAYRTLSDTLSDHRGVVADLTLRSDVLVGACSHGKQ